MAQPLQPGTTPSVPRLNIPELLSRSLKAPDYVLDGLPVGAVGAIVAPGGLGKTFLSLQVAFEVALGLPCLGRLFLPPALTEETPAPARVVYVMAEEPLDIVAGRTRSVLDHVLDGLCVSSSERAKAGYVEQLDRHLHIHPLAGRGQMRLDDDVAGTWSLETLSTLSQGARLVILDPMRQFHAGDENASWDMTHIVQRLQHIASRNRCAVLLTHHANKAATTALSGDRATAARGSSALTDALRWQVNLSPADDALITSHGLDTSARQSLLRMDLSKSNYLGPRAPTLLRRRETGMLERIDAPDSEATAAPPAARRPRRRSAGV
jgi:hypothetical protein